MSMTETSTRRMHQHAPWPDELAALVRGTKYKHGWQLSLVDDCDRGQDSYGTTLIIDIETPDAYHPAELRRVRHYMLVPPAAFDERSWRRWLFDQLLLVEQHEACEFFRVDGCRPYAPSHGPGNDPYTVRELSTDVDQRTSFRGEVKQP